MSVYEMAKKYYPQYWDRGRIQALVRAGKLSEEEAAEILADKAGGTDEA